MDRAYAEPLDVRTIAAVAHVSEAHFSRSFRAVRRQTPHRYLQRRRVERSMFLLRETDRSVTDICFDVGFSSLGTFSRTFAAIVGESLIGVQGVELSGRRTQLFPDAGDAPAGGRIGRPRIEQFWRSRGRAGDVARVVRIHQGRR